MIPDPDSPLSYVYAEVDTQESKARNSSETLAKEYSEMVKTLINST